MNMDRRRSNLEKRIQGVEEEIERQKKAKQGIQSLSKAYQDTPDFCDEKGHSDVSRQLVEVGVRERGGEGRGERGGRDT